MIYIQNDQEYKVKFYIELKSDDCPVLKYIYTVGYKEEAKILKYVEFLRVNGGHLDEPYSRHITGKLRELRIDFGRSRHRIIYFTFTRKTIILLHAFLKKTAKNTGLGNCQSRTALSKCFKKSNPL